MPEPREQELNLLLRRSDWRFLLGLPHPARAFCRAQGSLADAVAAVAGEVVTRGPDGDCDLAVAASPDAGTLAELYRALRAGGACYTEWDGRRDAAVILLALRRAGFAEPVCYRPGPAGAEVPTWWVPVDAPGAEHYVRSRARLPGGRLRRLVGGLRSRLAGGARRGLCAVARRPSESGSYDAPADWLREGWSSWAGGPAPERISTLLLTGGPRSVSKAVLLAFAEPGAEPLVAIKAPRVTEAASGLRREAAALEALGIRPGRVPGVPRLLFRREVGGVLVVGESAIVGVPLEATLGARTLRRWSLRVTDWLARLAADGMSRAGAHWRERLVEPALARFEREFGRVVDPGLLREGASIARAIGDCPAVPEQRDFGPWNLVVLPSGELGVLDWESAEVEGLPALDLLYYLAYASFNVERAHHHEGRVAAYRRALDPTTRTGSVRRECLLRYRESLGLPLEHLGPLRVLVWLIHTASDYRHAAADAGGAPSAAALERSLFLGLWGEEVRAVAAG